LRLAHTWSCNQLQPSPPRQPTTRTTTNLATQLREASETDGKAARCLEKLKLFRAFYVVVVVFIYFTRIVVTLLTNTLAYQHAWVAEAASCVAHVLLYGWVGWSFRPNADNAYTRLSQVEEVEMAL
jgi:hypothetical protein